MVFQNYALYPQMTVAQNLGFALDSLAVENEIKERVSGRLRLLGLEPLLGRIPGHSRAVSDSASRWVGRSYANPKVFLFDEPLSNLDAKLRVQIRGEIKALQQPAEDHHDLRHA